MQIVESRDFVFVSGGSLGPAEVATIGGIGGGYGAGVMLKGGAAMTSAIGGAAALGLAASYNAGHAVGTAIYNNSETVRGTMEEVMRRFFERTPDWWD